MLVTTAIMDKSNVDTVQFHIENTIPSDLPGIYHFFERSITYQEARGYPVWWNYDKQAIIKDIADRNQYKIVVASTMAMVFSVCYKDALIWRDRDIGNSLYLHRIVVNPDFKGQRLFGVILKWSIAHCLQKGLKNVRMDTWAENLTIIEYYKGFGFKTVENYVTPDTVELPVHNRRLALTLLEYSVD